MEIFNKMMLLQYFANCAANNQLHSYGRDFEQKWKPYKYIMLIKSLMKANVKVFW